MEEEFAELCSKCERKCKQLATMIVVCCPKYKGRKNGKEKFKS
jgi:hypothetical protein